MEYWYAADVVDVIALDIEKSACDLVEIGFDVMMTDDITEATLGALTAAWGESVSRFEEKAIDPDLAEFVLSGSERWSRHRIMLKSGDLSVSRIVADKL